MLSGSSSDRILPRAGAWVRAGSITGAGAAATGTVGGTQDGGSVSAAGGGTGAGGGAANTGATGTGGACAGAAGGGLSVIC